MTDRSILLYMAAKKDKAFLSDLHQSGFEGYVIGDDDYEGKNAIAATYNGWLIGKGLWEEFKKSLE
jgi:hypothetical protein